MKGSSTTEVIAAVFAVAVVPCFGATVLTEAFSYPTGPIVGATGSPWVSHSGATAGQVDVAGGVLNLTSAETEDVSAPLVGQPFTTGQMTAAMSVTFSALPTATGSYFAHFKDGASGFRGRLTASTTGAAAGFFRLGISNDGGATVYDTTDLSLATSYAVSFTWNLDTNQSSFSVNGGPMVTDTDATTAISVTSFAFRQATGMGSLTVDNLSVVSAPIPEPLSVFLGAIGVLGLLRKRR